MLVGSTSQIIFLFFRDAAGAPKTGLAYDDAGAVASYARPGAARQAITLATQTVDGAWSSGGFVEVDATNMPGLYRFDPPNAAFAAGAEEVQIAVVFTDAVQDPWNEKITGYDPSDGVSLGLTGLDRAIGLVGENKYIDNAVVDGSGRMTSCRLRIYSVAGSVGTSSDVIATYNITCTYTGVETQPTTYSQVKA